MKDKYLIKGVGINDSYIYLTEKDVWDWLEYKPTKPCPVRLADSMWSWLKDLDEHDSKQDMINWYENQEPDLRAAQAQDIGKSFNTVTELVKYVQKNNINIVSEAEFGIY